MRNPLFAKTLFFLPEAKFIVFSIPESVFGPPLSQNPNTRSVPITLVNRTLPPPPVFESFVSVFANDPLGDLPLLASRFLIYYFFSLSPVFSDLWLKICSLLE